MAGIHPTVRSLAAGRHYGSTDAWPLIPGVDAVARTADGVLIYTGFVEAPDGTLVASLLGGDLGASWLAGAFPAVAASVLIFLGQRQVPPRSMSTTSLRSRSSAHF